MLQTKNIPKQCKIILNHKVWAILLVEPYNHRVNPDKRAIQIFKKPFISGLCSVDAGFPLQLRCYLLQQAEITLDLLQTSRSDPTKSAYKIMNGKFDYNKTPLAPTGMKALTFKAATRSAAWAPHAVDGWYPVPAILHYRARTFFIESTRGICISSNYKLIPSHCKMR